MHSPDPVTSPMTSSVTSIATITTADPAGTAMAAQRLAPRLRAGDCLYLDGPLGSGKSLFARALIRRLLGDEEAEVPSPTFTLVQLYEPDGGPPVWHADLYRLSAPEDVYDLGLEEEADGSIQLIEWPDRLPDGWRPDALNIALRMDAGAGPGLDSHVGADAGRRVIDIGGRGPFAGTWARRLEGWTP